MQAADGEWIVKLTLHTNSRLPEEYLHHLFRNYQTLFSCCYLSHESETTTSLSFYTLPFPSNNREKRGWKDPNSRRPRELQHATLPLPSKKNNFRKEIQPSITGARSSRGFAQRSFTPWYSYQGRYQLPLLVNNVGEVERERFHVSLLH